MSIIGLGYVGLPLATAVEAAGFRTIGIDTSQDRVEAVNRGDYSPERTGDSSEDGVDVTPDATDPHESAALRFSATTDYATLKDSDIAIICVPTPLSKTGDPDLSYVIAAADGIAKGFHPGMLPALPRPD